MKLAKMALVAGAAALALTGCVAGQQRDLEGVNPRNPDKVELYVNVDEHPNIARVCIDGVALVTTSRVDDPIIRVPEWDSWCKQVGTTSAPKGVR